MKLKLYIFFILILNYASIFSNDKNDVVKIKNNFVEIAFDKVSASYSLMNLSDGDFYLEKCKLKINEWISNDIESKNYVYINEYNDDYGHSKELVITNKCNNRPDIIVKFKLYDNRKEVIVSAGIVNNTSYSVRLRNITPLFEGYISNSFKANGIIKVLDGNGGGESTSIQDNAPVYSRNNILISNYAQNKNIVLGGLVYKEYDKQIIVNDSISRSNYLEKKYNAIAYLKFPFQREVVTNDLILSLGDGYAYEYKDVKNNLLKNIIYSNNEIFLNILKHKKTSKISCGLSFSTDKDERIQSILIDNGPSTKRLVIIDSIRISKLRDSIKEVIFSIPSSFINSDLIRVIIKKCSGKNAVLNEAWVSQGEINKSDVVHINNKSFSVVSLIANDPVGRLVKAGEEYFSRDNFYIDIATSNHFESLENYSAHLKKYNKVTSYNYSFPTICLWYAQHPYYGGGPSINNSKGAVEEMLRVGKTGFLQYAPVAIRLVPDCYEQNNEQGWWDDEHFRKYGSGNAVPGEITVDKHYVKPYETTEKWSKAVLKNGGLSFLYLQTAKRSQDFADSFPSMMLYNKSNTFIPDYNWTVNALASYDFTDKAFVKHLKSVYNNFKRSKISGLMYDYTNTGWPIYGGMDDSTITAAEGYRRIYEIAANVLKKGSYLDERCLERGSDITIGLATSQRIWGDTDDITPEMIKRGSLRWYKNKQIFSYDMDAKNLNKVTPKNEDGVRRLLTMTYFTSGRLLLANSFEKLSDSTLSDLSKLYPYHNTTINTRPIDIFERDIPKIFFSTINDYRYSLVLYNQFDNKSDTVTVDFMNLIKSNRSLIFHCYDFWNDKYIGTIKSDQSNTQILRNGEARVLTLVEKKDIPQVLSTNRHILQGVIEITNEEFSNKVLKINTKKNLGPTFEIVIAKNNYRNISKILSNVEYKILFEDESLIKIKLITDNNRAIIKIHFN